MKIHYYSGWFEAFPKQMVELFHNDILDRKSIAIIWGWLPKEPLSSIKDQYFDPISIVFDEYHLIDSSMPKEIAHQSLRDASVIFLMGGYTILQNAFLMEYDLAMPIKESRAAVVIGLSAGAKNMAAKCICMKSNGYNTEKNGVFDGLGLNNFCYEPYFTLDNDELLKNELLPLSKELDVYATSDGSFIRVENGEVAAYGDTYLISCGEDHKI